MKSKKNILLITDDQHRWDFYDNRVIAGMQTPNLTRLMDEGVTLTNTFANCPICMPARFTWMYGLYAGQCAAGLLNNHHDWPMELPSMPQALQKIGYHTALVGKLHAHAGLRYVNVLEEKDKTHQRGFDDVFETCGKSLSHWYDCNFTKNLEDKGLLDDYRADVYVRHLLDLEEGRPTFLKREDTMDTLTGDAGVQWLQEYEDDKPFFLHLSFCGPHFPLDPPEEFASRHKPEDMPPPECVEDEVFIELNKKHRAAYAAMIEHVDEEIGKTLSVLEERGMLEDTIIFFGTDHGDMMGHHQRIGKMIYYDGSARTPYIVRFPDGCNAGKILDGMVEAVDLPCAILEAAGYTPEDLPKLMPQTPGQSFYRYARSEVPEHREDAYSECWTIDHPVAYRMLRTRDWKYVFRKEGDVLFDMVNDPLETENLIDRPEHQARISDMRRRLIERMMRCVTPSRPGATYTDGFWWLDKPGNAERVEKAKAAYAES